MKARRHPHRPVGRAGRAMLAALLACTLVPLHAAMGAEEAQLGQGQAAFLRVAFDANGGEGAMRDLWLGLAVSGEAGTAPACEFTLDGSEFAGWLVGANAPDSFVLGDADALAGFVTCDAQGNRHDLRDYAEDGVVVLTAVWKERKAGGPLKIGKLSGTVKGKKFDDGTYTVTTRLSSSYYLTAASAAADANVRLNAKKSSNRNQQWAIVNLNGKACHAFKLANDTSLALYNTGSSLGAGGAKLRKYSGSGNTAKLGIDENPGTHYSFFSYGATSNAGVLDVVDGTAADGKNVSFRARTEAEEYSKYTPVGSSTTQTNGWYGTNKSRSHWVVSKATYKVSFNGNGSTGGSTAAQTHWIDSATTLTANGFTRSYAVSFNANGGSCPTASATATYTFKGWNMNAGGTGTSYANKKSVKNLSTNFGATVTLYAQWNSASVSLPTPTRTGYDFAGWYTAASGGSRAGAAGASYTPTSNATLYAQWTPHTYTVTYYGNGTTAGSTPASSHSYGTSRQLSANGFARSYTVSYDCDGMDAPAPSTAAYGFARWTTAANGSGTAYSNGQAVSNLTAAKGGNVNLYAQWSAASVTLPDAQRPGYAFEGWYDARAGGSFAGVAGSAFTPTADTVLYARHSPNTAHVVQHRNDPGEDDETVSQDVTAGGGASFLPVGWKRLGYALLGWSAERDATSASWGESGTIPDSLVGDGGERHVYAVWSAYGPDDRYRVEFDPNGGTGGPAPMECGFGAEYALPAGGTSRVGYSLSGWSPSPDGSGGTQAPGSRIADAAAPGATLVLYAQWSANEITVRFDGNGATSGSVGDMRMRYDREYALPSGGFARTCTVSFDAHGGTGAQAVSAAFGFAGWGDDPSGNGRRFAPAERVSNLAESGELKLFAQWDPPPVRLPGSVREGYELAGWAVGSPDGEFAGGAGDAFEPAGDTVLHAVWRPHRYTVEFRGAGGSGSMDSLELAFDERSKLPPCGFALRGHSFAGWALAPAGNAELADCAEVIGLAPDDGATVELFATWEPVSTLATFHENAGTGSFAETFAYGAGDIFPPCPWAKRGYSFAGWSPDAAAESGDFPAGAEVPDNLVESSESIDLHAIWTPARYMVEFDPNGGTGKTAPMDMVYDEPAVLPDSAFDREGHAFAGWSPNPADHNARFQPGDTVTNLSEGEPVVLYAVWRPAPRLPAAGQSGLGPSAVALCGGAAILAVGMACMQAAWRRLRSGAAKVERSRGQPGA